MLSIDIDEMGASHKSLEIPEKRKGYQLVGTNVTGSNAFFVKEELSSDKLPNPASAENLYNPFRLNKMKYSSGHPSKK